jgi:hypothetical protein
VLAIASKRSPLAQYCTRSSMAHVAGKLYICIIYRKEWSLAIEQYTSRNNRSKQFSWCSSSPICKRAQAVQTGGVHQIQQTQHMENAGGSRSGSGRGATNDKCALFGWTRPRPRPAVEKGLVDSWNLANIEVDGTRDAADSVHVALNLCRRGSGTSVGRPYQR